MSGMIRNSSIALLCAIAASAPNVSAAQGPRASVAGCYRIELGPWTPPLGASAQFHTPPERFRLSVDSTSSFGPGWFQVTPLIEHTYSRNRARGGWSPMDSSGLRVLWSDGFTGADLRLFNRGFALGKSQEFFGVIQALSDAIGPIETVPKASVTAWRTECQ